MELINDTAYISCRTTLMIILFTSAATGTIKRTFLSCSIIIQIRSISTTVSSA